MASSKKNFKGMTDDERLQLMEKMDRELDEFIENASAKSKAAREKEGPKKKQTIDELADELLRHPLFMKEIDPSQPMSNEALALQALKFEDEDPTAKAESYKDEGNYYFQKNDNRLAATNYTEGILAKSPDQKLNAILYSNRAAAQYHLGNFHSSLRDCVLSRKYNPVHFKPVMRGIQCCMEMKRYKDAVAWCDAGLTLEPENKNIQDLRSKADKLQRAEEKEKRKQAAKERKKTEDDQQLVAAIKIRGISLAGLGMDEKVSDLSTLSLSSLESHHPSGAMVHLSNEGSLQWPVLFIYPEHGQTDFIEAFHENSRFIDHISQMFSTDADPPSWDEERKYQPNKLMVYFEEKEKEKLHVVNTSCTLLEVLSSKSYIVRAGTPSFILLIDGSKFQQSYLKKYFIA